MWLNGLKRPGYLVTTLVDGLKRLGVTVVDWPRQDSMYTTTPNCNAGAGRMWGKGYFIFCRVAESSDEVRDRGRIAEALAAGEFDAALFHFPDPRNLVNGSVEHGIPAGNYSAAEIKALGEEMVAGWPHWADIARALPRREQRVVFSDEDLVAPMTCDPIAKLVRPHALYFRRETHGCGEPIYPVRAHAQAMRPPDLPGYAPAPPPVNASNPCAPSPMAGMGGRVRRRHK